MSFSDDLAAVEVVESEGDEDDGVGLEEILFQYRAVILDLDRRVSELEARPTFAASVRGKVTGL